LALRAFLIPKVISSHQEVKSPSRAILAQSSPIPDLIDPWLNKLAKRENCSPTGTWDNGSFSYGAFCYKFNTFKGFVRQYELLPNAEDNELYNWIGDTNFQRELTELIVLYEPPNVVRGLWLNTITKKGVGLPPAI
jgi:hypothetical protein